jgi:hypothetical protein
MLVKFKEFEKKFSAKLLSSEYCYIFNSTVILAYKPRKENIA